ncbi:DUF6879 family protein [Crossiella sp. S99.1]|uniref:DUF6879 family protein n=1 Tax=Crossiella sp. S99.1 TaxID=2936271 RepID=UPI001FFF4A31|nr:DUF6879 family protein [Crossiella sp. S99.1]MCK2258294.1 hypothetical protein [Crossiella sp. S99.1]
MTVLDGAQAWALFENFRRSAWRLEAQATYTMPSEQPTLARFLAGEPQPDGHNSDWHDDIRRWASQGKTISRVRVVSQPLTDYQRYQLAWGIPGNVNAGEDVRILDRSAHTDVVVPHQDFWLFDDQTVLLLNFDDAGRLVDRVLVDQPDLDQYRAWQQAALAHAVPVLEWQGNARS